MLAVASPPACSNSGELGREPEREGFAGPGCLRSRFRGGGIFLFDALTAADYIGFQPASLSKRFRVENA